MTRTRPNKSPHLTATASGDSQVQASRAAAPWRALALDSHIVHGNRCGEIIQAEHPRDFETAKFLIEEYTASLGLNLDFQQFDRELQHFPGHYASPDGRVLLAKSETQVAGCGCLRRLAGDVCEMKRLYMKSEYRGRALGKQLALAAIHEANLIGYRSMKLDTLPTMSAAMALYEALGFRSIEPYYDNPIEGALFFELKL